MMTEDCGIKVWLLTYSPRTGKRIVFKTLREKKE